MPKTTTLLVALLAIAVAMPAFAPAGAASENPERVSFTSGSVRETFIATAYGGIEDATAVTPTPVAVRRLRAHMRQGAKAFARGSFVDPTNPHGDLVPGLREMHGQWNKMQVRYADLPTGARITYVTHDPVMVEALHQWFVARAVNKIR